GGDAPADAERIDHAAEPVAPEHVAARRSPATRAMRRGRWYSPARHERRCGPGDPWRCPAAPGYIARAGGRDHGSVLHRRGGSLPRPRARVGRGERPRPGVAQDARRHARLAAEAPRRRVPGRRLAEGVRRRRALRDAAGDPERGARPRPRAAGGERDGDLVGRARHHPLRDGRAEKALHPPHPHRGRDLGDGLLRATSGSDMAAARTRAVRDGDVYVVNGQKIWTTYAHISDWFFVLVRTSAEGPKWAG